MTIPRILVVDDDPEMRQMMTQFLRKHGTIALPAATEAEVAAHLEGGRVDLILLDVMLGDENGLDICGRLRQEQDVPIIMVSYSVLALATLFAHAQLGLLALCPRRVIERLGPLVDGLHYWYIHVGSILLLAGIITGSMWGASSWGRYWGWDPKEVWSLIAFVGYLAILHVRVDHEPRGWLSYLLAAGLTVAVFTVIVRRLWPLSEAELVGLSGVLVALVFFGLARGPFATAMKSISAFWLIIMTYVGVNFVLGVGLHSYGFGKGAVAWWMFVIGGIDLAFILVLGLIYLARVLPAAPATRPGPA